MIRLFQNNSEGGEIEKKDQNQQNESYSRIEYFGSYRYYHLSWIELDYKDSRHLLLCNNIIEYLPFHEKYASVNWETCSVREWLNKVFFFHAFNECERRYIIGDKSDENDCEYIDNVFLLSSEEAHRYFDKYRIRIDGPAPYLVPKHIGKYIGLRRRDVWLLRTNAAQGNNSFEISNVIDSGEIHMVNDQGRNLNVNCEAGIRPALWISDRYFF